MKVGQINLPQRSIRLAAGSTKSKEPRLVIMTQRGLRAAFWPVSLGKIKGGFVFTRGTEPVLDFRGAWHAPASRLAVLMYDSMIFDRTASGTW